MKYVAAVARVNVDGERRDVLFEIEATAIRHVLNACGGNITEAARRLGLHRQSLQRKMRRHGLVAGERSASEAPEAITVGEPAAADRSVAEIEQQLRRL